VVRAGGKIIVDAMGPFCLLSRRFCHEKKE
jgi:hypothetical protein